MPFALLIDLTTCVGCGECRTACQNAHGFPEVEIQKLTANNFTYLEEKEDLYIRRMCQHCEEPACASVCPVGALYKTSAGPVNYDADKCIGCRYCMLACPFDVPSYEWDSINPRVRKCTMCYDERTSKGEATACSEACPAEATLFGERSDLIAEALTRINDDPDSYVPKIYGQAEAGGTSVLYISSVPFEELGFKSTLGYEPLPDKTWDVLSKLPNVVVTAGVMVAAVYWITNRRSEVMEFNEAVKADDHRKNNGREK
jgi:formate dehydrogenase iron-sulfur subunit